MYRRLVVFVLGAAVLLATPRAVVAQLERPIPYPVIPPPAFREALEAGTRSVTGLPGERYWQQWAEYENVASLDVEAKRLTGTTRIRYHNRSPDVLDTLHVHLRQNLHAPGAERNRVQEVTGGVQLGRVVVQETPASTDSTTRPSYVVRRTILSIALSDPLQPGGIADLEIDWEFTIPQSGASRMGYSRGNLFYLAYWYPQMAVYDDVDGWQTDPYLGDAEFAAGFGSYDVTIEVPQGWVVRATGTLQNPADVLPQAVQDRLAAALTADTVVHVLTERDFGPGRATTTSPSGRLAWRFTADHVRDFAFSVTSESLWDATRTPVGDRNGNGQTDYTLIESLWRASAPRWANTWRYAQHSIDFLSRFTGLSYPWPHMTAVEGGGIRGGGMEYPMMTLMGDYNARSDTSLYSVTAHELAHMWVPMQIANDEKRHAWLDEGTTSFNDVYAQREFYPGSLAAESERENYLRRARTEAEGELMRWTEFHYPGRSGTASYAKPAELLTTLWGLLGGDVFLPAYHRFLADWRYKHPQPWDFFNSFNHSTGQNLDWFWRTWYYETWSLDQAVQDVRYGDAPMIVIEDVGLAPMPARLTITLADGSIVFREVPVAHWLKGRRTAEVRLPAGSHVIRVVIDAEHAFPDKDRSNNVWVRREQ